MAIRGMNRRAFMSLLGVAAGLDELLEGITPENLHDEVQTGRPQGREIW